MIIHNYMAGKSKSPRSIKKRKVTRLTKADKERIKLVKNIVIIIAGQVSEKIVNLLYGKENVNEFDIAKKLKLTINQARNILYKLADYGLVSFNRKKDKKNGGWYTYFWTLDLLKALQVLHTRITKEIDHFQKQLQSRKAKRYYQCENCEIEMIEENALLNNFICPECGEVFQLKDNSEEISHLEEHLGEKHNELGLVSEEIKILEAEQEIMKEKTAKKEALKVAKARAKARALRASLKKKTQKISPVKKSKKVTKKKPSKNHSKIKVIKKMKKKFKSK